MSLLESTLHLCQNLVLACAGGQVVHVHVDGMRLQSVLTEIYSVCLVGLVCLVWFGLVSLVARLLVFRNLRMRVRMLELRRWSRIPACCVGTLGDAKCEFLALRCCEMLGEMCTQ